MATFQRSRPIRKDQKANFSSPPIKDLGKQRNMENPANIGKIRHLGKDYTGGPHVDPVRKALRELEDLTGRKIQIQEYRVDEKFMGLLPDDVEAEPLETRGMKMIHQLNNQAGVLVVRRLYTDKGFALVLVNPAIKRNLMNDFAKFGLEQTRGPAQDEDGHELIWLRDSETKVEHVSPHTSFSTLCESVTRSGKYTFESVADLQDFIVDRAIRDGISGSRLELETQLVDFLVTTPPPRSIFSKIGIDEQFVIEGRIR